MLSSQIIDSYNRGIRAQRCLPYIQHFHLDVNSTADHIPLESSNGIIGSRPLDLGIVHCDRVIDSSSPTGIKRPKIHPRDNSARKVV